MDMEETTKLFEQLYKEKENITKDHILKLYEQYNKYDRIHKFCLDIEAEWDEYVSRDARYQRRNYVYFVRNTVNGLIKIGCTRDIKNRYSTIKSTCLTYFGLEDCIEMIGAIDTSFIKCGEVEKYFHEKYTQYRKFGEWFELPQNELDTLEQYYFSGDYECDDMINHEEIESIGLTGRIHNITYVGNPRDEDFMEFLYSRYDINIPVSDNDIEVLAKLITERTSGIKLYPLMKTINNISFYRYTCLRFKPLFIDTQYDLCDQGFKVRGEKIKQAMENAEL